MHHTKNIFSILLAIFFIAAVPASACAEDGQTEGKTGYDHGFFIKSGDDNYSIKFRFFSSIFYEYDANEDATDTNSFGLRRARMMIDGSVFSPNFQYMIMPEFVTQYASTTTTTAYTVVDTGGDTSVLIVTDTDTNDRNFRLLYLWGQYRFSDAFRIRFGEFRAPTEFFRRSQFNEFADSPIVNTLEPFTPYYQTGIEFLGTLRGKFNYEVFAANGTNLDRANINKAFQVGASLTYNFLGAPNQSVADISHAESPEFALTVSGAYDRPDLALAAPANVGAGDDVFKGQANALLHYRGFSLAPEFIVFYDRDRHFRHYAFVGQTGFFIIPRHMEIAAQGCYLRYSGAANDRYEFIGGLNYYFYGHPVKLQLDYSLLINKQPADDQTNHRVRLNAQIGFF